MTDVGRTRALLSLVSWCVALAAGVVLFHWMGDGPLAAPPLDPAGWSDWADGRDPLVATVAVLRLLALALSWYLVGVTTIGIVARVARAARWVRVADALTVPMVRRLLQAALGLSLATAVVAASVPSAPTGAGAGREDRGQRPGGSGPVVTATASLPEDGAPTLRRTAWDPDGGDHLDLRPAAGPGTDAPVLRRVAGGSDDPGAGPPTDGRDTVPTLRRAADGSEGDDREVPMPLRLAMEHGARPGASEADTAVADGAHEQDDADERGEQQDAEVEADDQPMVHEVRSGDSLWRIAEQALARTWDREPDDREVEGYWRELIEHNRSSLVDPDNPDLILPGQQMQLPELPTDRVGR